MPPKTDAVSPEAVYDAVAAFALFLHANAAGCRIVIDVPDGFGGVSEARIVVPLPRPEADNEGGAVLAALAKMRPGEWVRGKTLAAELDVDPNNGHFRRTLGELVAGGKVQSNKQLGYRLAREKDPA